MRWLRERLVRWRPPRTDDHIACGQFGESLAARHLRHKGYRVLFRNFRAPSGGEVDIVCRDRSELVFVEVKTRSSDEFGRPADAVDQKKRRLMLRGGFTWLKMLDNPDVVFRFDIIEVILTTPPTITHIENAFPLPDSYSY